MLFHKLQGIGMIFLVVTSSVYCIDLSNIFTQYLRL